MGPAATGEDDRHSLIVEAVAEGIYDWNVESNALWGSARLNEIFGLQDRGLTAADWNRLVHPDDFPAYRAAIRDCFRGKTARLHCEYRARHNDGTYRWIEDRGIPVRNAAGRAVRLVGALTDITDRKAAEQALREALDRQTATADILRVIASTPGDPAHALDTISETAVRIFGASNVAIRRLEDDILRLISAAGPVAALHRQHLTDVPFDPATGIGRCVAENRQLHFDDLAAMSLDGQDAAGRLTQSLGIRVAALTPLTRDGRAIGVMIVHRSEPRPFRSEELELMRGFADQAVIAIENARLINETREALEQQTATAEVLQVINSSPGDLAPVFDAMLEKAMRLCGAVFGELRTYDGEVFRTAATRGVPAAYVAYRSQNPPVHGPGTGVARILAGERVVHVVDLMEEEAYRNGEPNRRALVELGGVRTSLQVALVKDGAVHGSINIYRQEVRAFSDKEIGLVQNFAAQAVIAIENARLITETREALEQQTATAEVLQVINASPGDLGPVFEAMLEKAVRLLNADFGIMWQFEDGLMRLGASYNVADAFIEYHRQPMRPGPESGPGRMMRGGSGFITPNFLKFPAYLAGDPAVRSLVELAGARSAVIAPLRKDGTALGSITIYRKEVQPFSEKQLAVLENFAAQAVIAMENARLITETREALQQQTATAEVLGVINSSPGDLTPVFDAILEKGTRLCEARFGILSLYKGDDVHQVVALRDVPEPVANLLREPAPLGPETGMGRLVRGERFVHIPDAADDAGYRQGNPIRRALVDVAGTRTCLGVPLRKDDTLLGAFTIYRQEVRPFTDKQIALLENFAAQAVIAMENARLITETREALDRQTATAEVLQVINSSPGDLAPVFQVILEKAHALCGVESGGLVLFDGDHFRLVANHAMPERHAENVRRPYRVTPGSAQDRLLRGERFVQIEDVRVNPTSPQNLSSIEAGTRTLLQVPLRKDGALLGFITSIRREVRPFSGKEITLLENFAAQAVIAIENARLITETREALEQQTATAEVLGVINSSPGDLAPVFDAMLEKALTLCGGAIGSIFQYDGVLMRQTAARGHRIGGAPLREFAPQPGDAMHDLAHGAPLVHIADVIDTDAYRAGVLSRVKLVEDTGARTVLWVPLRKDGALLGVIALHRTEVRPFSDKQIALLQNFAAQAVIAIENARLITETREALDQQTATAEVSQVINSSPGDLAPVFDAMLERATRLCEAQTAHLLRYDDGAFSRAASFGVPEEFDKILPLNVPLPNIVTSDAVPYRMVASRSVVHVSDLREDESYLRGAPAEIGAVESGIRTALFVPLLKDGEVAGCFVMHRMEVRPFSERQIALLQSFAAQAVIAMDNARLLEEIRQRQAELRVTFDNMGDGVVMFDAELKLAAWNRNLQELLQLPESFFTEPHTYEDYLRYLAGRGEFGQDDVEAELTRRLDNTDRELRFERSRPDGRIIEVRRNSVPGGGFVLIYSDITERKRAEEEIRAARDAAEKALGELKVAQASLIHAEKMASLGQLTAGIAHEIKNPLNFVNNFAALSVELLGELKAMTEPAVAALDDEARADIGETIGMLTGNLDKIGEHGRRADGIVKSMLAHSRGTSGERDRVDLNALVDEALNLAYHGARAQDQNFNITIERDFGVGIAPVELVPQDATRVFLNLIGNGFHATHKRLRESGDRAFRPVLKVTTRDLGDAAEVRVRDNGTGIRPEHRGKLFQPFFTTKPTGEGTGLGLSISYDIVTQQHGGMITVESELGAFTEFTVRLPRHHNGTTTGRLA